MMPFELTLIGPFRLERADGTEIRLGRKGQALLAILVMARGRPRSRAALQDLLWSDRGELHGRDSLKKALAALRTALGDAEGAIVRTSGGPVSLDVRAFRIDLFDRPDALRDAPQALEFMEGCEVRDRQFEHWLRDTRRSLTAVPAEGAASHGALTAPPPLPSIAICAPHLVGRDGMVELLASVAQNRLLVGLGEGGMFAIHDHRTEPTVPPACDLALDLAATGTADWVMLNFSLRRPCDRFVVWSQTHSIDPARPTERQIGEIVSQCMDQIVTAAFNPAVFGSEERHVAAKLLHEGVGAMFRLSAADLARADVALQAAISVQPRGVFRAWHAYLSAFRLEASQGDEAKLVREQAREAARLAMEAEPGNSVSRALLAHVHGFVLHDVEGAAALLKPIGTESDNPMYFHARSMHHFYAGRYDEALLYAKAAHARGMLHPYRYAFSTSLCMICLLRGDVASAIAYGEEALRLQDPKAPRYGPAVRYLLTAYMQAGDRAGAERLWSQMDALNLLKVESTLNSPGGLIPSPEARDIIKSNLSRLRPGDTQRLN